MLAMMELGDSDNDELFHQPLVDDGNPHLALRVSSKEGKKQQKLKKLEKKKKKGPFQVPTGYIPPTPSANQINRNALYYPGACRGPGPQYRPEPIPFPDYDDKRDQTYTTRIHEYTEEGDMDKITETLKIVSPEGQRLLVNKLDSDKRTPLHIAALHDNIKIASKLVQAGADIHAEDNDQITPLHLACQSNTQSQCSVLRQIDETEHETSARKLPRHEVLEDGTTKALEKDTPDPNDQPSAKLTKPTHSQTVKFLLDIGANKRAEDKYQMTPLHYAAVSGNAVALGYLMKTQHLDLMAQDRELNTPLHYAALHCHAEFCIKMLEVKVDLEIKNINQATPIHCAASGGCEKVLHRMLQLVADNGRDKIQRVLLDKDKDGNHLLLLACEKYTRQMRAVNIIIEATEEAFGKYEPMKMNIWKMINLPNNKMEYPIHKAAKNDHPEIVATLCDMGACVDEEDNQLNTPLHHAAFYNNHKSIEALLYRIAAVNRQNVDGMTPLMIAAQNGFLQCMHELLSCRETNPALKNNKGKSALLLAAEKKHLYAVKVLMDHFLDVAPDRLKDGGSSSSSNFDVINDCDLQDNTALHIAVKTGNIKMTECLLMNSANCGKKNHEENTPLHLATVTGQREIARLILDKDPNSLFSANVSKNTPLHLAAKNGYKSLCRLLLGRGADVSKKNYRNWTPLEMAVSNGYEDVVKHLLEKGAKVNGENSVHPILIAAEKGHKGTVEILIKHGADIKVVDEKGFNCLDIAITQEHQKTVDVILNSEAWEDALDNITLLKYKENHGVRPLHVNMLDTPMRRLIRYMPESAYKVFDKCIDLSLNYRSQQVAQFNFKYIDDYQRLNNFVEEVERPSPGKKVPVWMQSPPHTFSKKNTGWLAGIRNTREYEDNHPLSLMVETDEKLYLVDHPLCQTLIQTKWERVGMKMLLGSFLLYATFIALLTTFMMTSQVPYLSSNSGEKQNGPLLESFRLVCPYILIVISAIGIICLLLTALHSKCRHIDILAWPIELAVYILTLVLVCDVDKDNIWGYQWVCGTAALVMGWLHLIMYLQRFPKFGLYIVMFKQISRTFIGFIPIFFVIVIGFAMGFYTLFQNKKGFNTVPQNLAMTLVMLMGEIGYSGLMFPDNPERDFVYFTKVTAVFMVCFMIAMNIILINLLIGLAIQDIKDEKAHAERTTKMLRVQMTVGAEKVPMGYVVTKLQCFFRPCMQKKHQTELRITRENWTDKLLMKFRCVPTTESIEAAAERDLEDVEAAEDGIKHIRDTIELLKGQFEQMTVYCDYLDELETDEEET